MHVVTKTTISSVHILLSNTTFMVDEQNWKICLSILFVHMFISSLMVDPKHID